jgi:hypothetical protein
LNGTYYIKLALLLCLSLSLLLLLILDDLDQFSMLLENLGPHLMSLNNMLRMRIQGVGRKFEGADAILWLRVNRVVHIAQVFTIQT